jgi:hypothetical protein
MKSSFEGQRSEAINDNETIRAAALSLFVALGAMSAPDARAENGEPTTFGEVIYAAQMHEDAEVRKTAYELNELMLQATETENGELLVGSESSLWLSDTDGESVSFETPVAAIDLPDEGAGTWQHQRMVVSSSWNSLDDQAEHARISGRAAFTKVDQSTEFTEGTLNSEPYQIEVVVPEGRSEDELVVRAMNEKVERAIGQVVTSDQRLLSKSDSNDDSYATDRFTQILDRAFGSTTEAYVAWRVIDRVHGETGSTVSIELSVAELPAEGPESGE